MTHTASERTLAVLGSPIAHSQSPALHRAAYAVLGLPWSYQSVEMTSLDLADFVSSRGPEWRGLSLTMPLKHNVIPLVSTLDGMARLTGSANTILYDDPGVAEPDRAAAPTLRGFNTDVAGIVRSLGAAGLTTATLVHILGSGATAASAIAAAAELGTERVIIWARNPVHAAGLMPLAAKLGVAIEVRGPDHRLAEDSAELVISTLPGGADAGVAFPAELPQHALLFDVAYSPWPSALADRWLDAGGEVLSGLAMLVHQALLQVRIFVAGDPLLPLEREDDVLAAMLAAVHLDAAGAPVGRPERSSGGEPAQAVPES
ncbi:MAG TPA: shikimate dehydrogenase [Microbacteriaceae bacterium]